MVIYAKVGTMPAQHVHVFRKKKPPVVGEFFKIELDSKHYKYNQKHGVRCLEVRTLMSGQTLYVLERF